MLTCENCQFENPDSHKFCQRCGRPLTGTGALSGEVVSTMASAPTSLLLQATIQPTPQDMPAPGDYLPGPTAAPSDDQQAASAGQKTDQKPDQKRYQVVGSAPTVLVSDGQPQVKSPYQNKAPYTDLTLAQLEEQPAIPVAAYPYQFISHALPPLYDAWQSNGTAYLITHPNQLPKTLTSALATSIDPVKPVYWLYQIVDLWKALAPVPQWRGSLLVPGNLGLDGEHSVRLQQCLPPAQQLPTLDDLKGLLSSLLSAGQLNAAMPERATEQMMGAIAGASTPGGLSQALEALGEAFLKEPIPQRIVTQPPTRTTAQTGQEKSMSESPDPSVEISSDQVSLEASPSGQASETADGATPGPTDADLEATLLQANNESESAETDLESTQVLPMVLLTVDEAGQTDVGRQRDHNEDYFYISARSHKQSQNQRDRTQMQGLYILCDGMGGHAGGEVASQLAADTLSDFFEQHWPPAALGQAPKALPDDEMVIKGITLANQAIFDVNEKEQRAGHERMGTTLVMVLLQGPHAIVAHVGDSRLYQYSRRLGLKQVTTDHEVGQREIQRGVDPQTAYSRTDAYQLTQALGPRGASDIDPSIARLSFTEDTLLLLCSDGLSDNELVEDHRSSYLAPILRSQKDISQGVDDLVALGNEINGHDNITAIAIRLRVAPDLERVAD